MDAAGYTKDQQTMLMLDMHEGNKRMEARMPELQRFVARTTERVAIDTASSWSASSGGGVAARIRQQTGGDQHEQLE